MGVDEKDIQIVMIKKNPWQNCRGFLVPASRETDIIFRKVVPTGIISNLIQLDFSAIIDYHSKWRPSTNLDLSSQF